MGQHTRTIKQKNEHTSALKAAIANLEQFAVNNESAPIINVADFSVKEGKLIVDEQSQVQKTINLAKSFVAAIFWSKTRQQNIEKKFQVQEVVLKAIDIIKRNHLLIDQLQKGSSDDQKLAASALAIIKRYNTVLEENEKSLGWPQTISRFFYRFGGLSVDEDLKTNKIDLPRVHTIEIQPNMLANNKISHAFQSHAATPQVCHDKGFSAVMLTKVMVDPLSKQETDLLRMKANTLLKQHGIKFTSMAEALQAIKEAPIYTSVDEKNSMASLRLSLTLLPGLTIDLEGAFLRNSSSPQHSVPIPDKFKLVYSSVHSGFPMPFQYTGWALDNALIPSYPHRLDLLPLFQPLYQRKQEAIKALLPDGKHYELARKLWDQRQKLFKQNQTRLLELHRQLNAAIVGAAPVNTVPDNAESTINTFFEHLTSHPNPIEYLARTHQTINTHFIQRQQNKLQEIWLNRVESTPESIAQKARYELAEDNSNVLVLFDNEIKLSIDKCEQLALEYCKCMGSILQSPAQSIIMQYYTETLECPPRMLTDFEQKIQCSAYKQQLHFLDELDGTITLASEHVFEALESDIALFQVDSCDSLQQPYVDIAHELEVYFNSRYYSTNY